MTLRRAPENSGFDAIGALDALDSYETPLGGYLGAKASEGFWYSLPGQAVANARAGEPDRLQADAEGRISFGPPADVMSAETWKASPWYRDGLEWDARMTERRASSLAEIHDENAYRRWKIEASPTGARSFLGFGAQLLGGAPDPINYIPWFGPAARAAAAARFARVLGPTATRIAAPAVVQGAEAALGTAAIEPVLLPSARQFGDDVGFADAVMDVAFGALFGAGLGGTHGAWRAFKDRGTVHDVNAQAVGADTLSDAAADLAAGRPVDIEARALLEARDRIRREVDALRADPTREPGPAAEVLAELTPETMSQVVVQVRRGGALRDDAGNLILPSRNAEGMVKLELRHADVTDAEMMAMPLALREQKGVQISSTKATDVYDWRRQVDGVEITYRLKVRHKPKDTGKMYLVSIFRETDPAKFKGETERRAPVASDPLGRTGSLDQDTHRAFSGQKPDGRGQPASETIALSAPENQDVAVTPAGRRVAVRYELVEAADLTASHGDDLAANPAFPPELQPRDRTRAASAEQVAAIAADPIPELLGRSASAADGAPIVGPDGVVESGNGRVLGLRRVFAQNPEGAARYREFLAREGFDAEGMREPVLIRRRLDDLSAADRAVFAAEANERTTLSMGAAEQAQVDARNLPDHLFDLWRDGELTSAANRDFVRAWLAILPQSERGRLVDAQGRLSQEGLGRLQAALLSRAYDDPHLVGRMTESTDDNMRTIGRVLTDLAPDWIRLRNAVRAGEVVADMDQTRALMEAVGMVRRARDSGAKVRDLADQLDLFDPRAAEVRAFLHLLYGEELSRAVGRDKLHVALGRYLDDAMKNIAGPRLFGDALTAGQILDTVRGIERRADPAPTDARPPAAETAAASRVGQAGDLDALAREMGVDPKTGDFDEALELTQMHDAGRLTEAEANAVREAETAFNRAEDYENAFAAAAGCLTRTT